MANTKPRKLTLIRKPNEPILLEPGEAVQVGVDVHKASYSVALFSNRRGLIAPWVQARAGRSPPRATAPAPGGDRPGRLRGRADQL